MQWINPITWREYALIATFVMAYLAYFWRFWKVTQQLPAQDKRLFLVKLVLRGIYFSLFIIALLGPSFGIGKRTINIIGKDIFFLVDLSASMNVADVVPSRLQKAQQELKWLIEPLTTDRVGLIVFSSQAFLQCPLTFDKAALKLFIESLKTDLMPQPSTNLAEPLQMAWQRLNANNDKLHKAKAVVLITDGEDFAPNLASIIEQYRKQGIKILCLGVGTAKGGKIPTSQGFQRNAQGQEAISKPNMLLLNNIAQKTGGRFFELSNEKNEVPLLLQTIQQIKGEKLDNKQIDISYNKYAYFLALALFLLCLDMLIVVPIISLTSPQL